MMIHRESDGVTHVVPINDLRQHENLFSCWCNPAVDIENRMFVHNSMDRREEYEEGRKLH